LSLYIRDIADTCSIADKEVVHVRIYRQRIAIAFDDAGDEVSIVFNGSLQCLPLEKGWGAASVDILIRSHAVGLACQFWEVCTVPL
jgi:hypothetical protein